MPALWEFPAPLAQSVATEGLAANARVGGVNQPEHQVTPGFLIHGPGLCSFTLEHSRALAPHVLSTKEFLSVSFCHSKETFEAHS